MFECELIVGTGSDAVSLDLYDNLPLSVNFNIADIKEPEKRNGDYTKTIKLKGTKTNNIFFEQTYDVNIKTATWNPNIKTPAYFLKSGTVPMKGDLRLMSIDIIRKNEFEDITYNVVLIGRNANIFLEVGDSKLEDLDLSIYNHAFTYAKQNAAESNTIDISGTPTVVGNGVGYRYPLVDYGYNGWASNYYHVNHLRPAIFLKTYWDAIFAAAGKTYTSTFLSDTTDLFCRELMLHNGDKLAMSAAIRANYEFYAGMSGTGTALSVPLSYTSAMFNYSWYKNPGLASTTNNLCLYDDDTTNPFVDTPNMYSTSTGVTTIQTNGTYNILGNINLDYKVTAPAGTVTINTLTPLEHYVKLMLSTDGGSTWITQKQYIFYTNNQVTTSYQSSLHNLNFTPVALNSGDKLRVEYHPCSNAVNGIRFIDNLSAFITSGTATFDWRLRSSAVINCKLATDEIIEGQTLSINDAIPKDIKQKDFLISIIRKYNLYIDIDKTDPNNYIIEPRDDFYALGDTLDWSDKYAVDKETQIKPMGEVNIKNFYWKYKDDNDYYNKLYQDSYGESYGTKTYIVNNDFVKGDNKNELIFSPTPVVDNTVNDLIIPKIFSWDGTNVKPMKHNIRTVLWRGSVSNTTAWTYGSISGNVSKTSYQGVAMTDDPLASTESIEFGVPNEIFYDGITLTYTTNNLFNRFYAKQIEELTDRDSKIVTMYLKLDAQDISKFDFRNRVFIDKSYYYVNKIIDFNPLKDDLTKVELIKIKAGTVYTPAASVSITAIETNSGNTGSTARMGGASPTNTKVGEGNNLLAGENIVSRTTGGVTATGKNISVGGSCYLISVISSEIAHVGNNASAITIYNASGVYVGASANKIVLSNCSNVNVDDLVYNYTGFNVHDKTITTSENNTIEMGSTVIYDEPATSQTKTASFNVSYRVPLYYIDCTGGANITAQFNFSIMANRSVTFVRVDNSVGTFSITNTGNTATLQGSACPVDLGMSQWDSFTIHNDGTNFYIVG